MANMIPVKGRFDPSGDTSALGNFETGDVIDGSSISMLLSGLSDVSAHLGFNTGDQLVLSANNIWVPSASPLTEFETIEPFFNGSIIETIDPSVVESNTTVEYRVTDSDNTGQLAIRFAGATQVLSATPYASALLTIGTDTDPSLNYVYAGSGVTTPYVEANTTGWPTSAFAPLATVLVQSASSVSANEVYKHHAWTDHISNSTQGHAAHINKKLRSLEATWESGAAAEDLAVSTTNAYFITASGVVFQLHTHSFPAMNTSAGSSIYIVNDPGGAYTQASSLSSITVDADSTSLSNKYFNLVLWGVVSERLSECKLMVNLPEGVYNTEANAQSDSNDTAIYTIPTTFKGTGFLIARYTLNKSGGGTYSQSQKTDLRGLVPSISVGGTVTTDHGLLAGLGDDDHPQYILHSSAIDFELSAATDVSANTGAPVANPGDVLALSSNNVWVPSGVTYLTSASKSMTIESVTNSEDIGLFFTVNAITITRLQMVMVGTSPSVTWTVRHGTDRSATGAEVVTGGTTTTSTTSGDVIVSFNDATVVADSYIWLETTAQSGTVDEMELSLFYTLD